MEENITSERRERSNNTNAIAGAILIVGVLIAGAILLRGSPAPSGAAVAVPSNAGANVTVSPVGRGDRTIGNPGAKVTIIMYEDFQCPFCGKFFTESEQKIRSAYINDGSVQLVYRDFAFLGPESVRSAEAARCAGDQGKFWEYHDYLFTHQNGENQGNFADPRLKTFAVDLGLNAGNFNNCLDMGKYAAEVLNAKTEGSASGVSGTPKGYVLRDGKVVDTIDGAIPFEMVKQKIDSALK